VLFGGVVSLVFSSHVMTPTANPDDVFELIGGARRAGAVSFKGPAGVRCHPDGRIYVADDLAHRVLVFTASGDLLQAFGGQGTALGRLLFADAVHWDVDGRLYVADTGAHRIQVWDAGGRAIGAFGHAASPLLARARCTTGMLGIACVGGAVLVAGAHLLGWRRPRAAVAMGAAASVAGVAWAGLALAAPRVLDLPRDVWIGYDGLVYVADYGGDAVRVFDRAGTLIRTIGGSVTAADRLRGPLGLAIASDGSIYVTDSGNHRVQVFKADGAHIRTFGARGDGPGQFESPHGIALGPDGLVYVADRGNRRVQGLRPDGTAAVMLHGKEASIGEFTPGGLCVTPDGTLLIVDMTGHRVLGWRPAARRSP
jgi:DNA-binding beta-propeller fold protein YncE